MQRHRLEEMHARAPHADDAPLRAHLASCAVCSTRAVALDQARAAFLAAHPPAAFARLVAARAQQRRAKRLSRTRVRALGAVGCALAMAAAALLVVRPAPISVTAGPSTEPPVGAQGVRWKGSVPAAQLQVHLKRDAQHRLVTDGAEVRAGDQLGFVITAAQPSYVLLAGIDDAGSIEIYYGVPGPDEPKTAPLPAGEAVQLPLAIELDDHRGRERLIALLSAQPLTEGAVRMALRRAFDRTEGRTTDRISAMGTLELPAAQLSVWFRKP